MNHEWEHGTRWNWESLVWISEISTVGTQDFRLWVEAWTIWFWASTFLDILQPLDGDIHGEIMRKHMGDTPCIPARTWNLIISEFHARFVVTWELPQWYNGWFGLGHSMPNYFFGGIPWQFSRVSKSNWEILNIPIGSTVLLYMVTWIPSIYPLYVSIYTSTMDPMG